jgi:hypothetical protein
MRIALALAAVSALAVAGVGAAMPAKKGPPKQAPPKQAPAKQGVCTGTVTGPIAGDLVVPPGATCNASGAVVRKRVRVGRDATLTAGRAFTVRRGIDVARGATLQVVARHIAIGRGVSAHGARKVALVRTPSAGSRATVEGSVRLFATAEVSVLSLTIGGSVLVLGGGGEGMELGANRIGGSLVVTRVRLLRPQQPRVFSIRSNTIRRDVGVLDNVATGASSPPFIGGNRLRKGSLLCVRNTPAPVNSGPGGPEPNIVQRGAKRGQCASL